MTCLVLQSLSYYLALLVSLPISMIRESSIARFRKKFDMKEKSQQNWIENWNIRAFTEINSRWLKKMWGGVRH